ncbi:unnamed protein product [Arabidopsis arenosa]|uniref:Transposase Tnp1/En/Spm-like domain-containing protein n=1 Tax=Arabidopsis arenosa TaxID=38785 RepID=A0A8S1ZU81_ARAAE|nr:unnamed protein product [Arabidopsis arenosa]
MCRSSAKDTSQVVDLVSYYGRIIDIILLDYNMFYVPLFRCQWAVRGNGVKVEDGFTLVNLNQGQVSFLQDPYILASPAKQVFYSREDDSSNWFVVMRGSTRRYSKEDVQDGNADIGPLQAAAEGRLPAEVTDKDGVQDEPEGEVELSEDHQPKRKKHRGPTKMKNIAKDPTVREKVDYTLMGDPYGPGSVKLSSYVGTLVRELVHVIIETGSMLVKISKQFCGNMFRSFKSRIVKDINEAANNQQRMNMRPMNVSPTDWRRFVKVKTSTSFKAVSDKYKERRSKQIPHTTSRKGMVRLAEDVKIKSGDPSEVTRLKVWVKSRTKKDDTLVNTNAAEKIMKAVELVGSDAPTTTTNPEEDHLSQLLGPDNPGRMRAMGRGISKTKLACFQVKTKCMTDMQEKEVQLLKKVNELQEELSKMKNQSVNKRSHPKCVLVDWSDSDENIGEERILSSDPDDLVNDCRLGPTDLKVLVETATKADAFIWRPATKMFTIEEAVGQIIAWPASKCVLLDKELQIEDIAPLGLRVNSLNKCKLLDLSNDDVIVDEGRWQTQEETALVNGLPLGPKAVKVFVDSVLQPETFIWRPTIDMIYLEDCLMAFVSWPVNKVSFENPSAGQHSASTDIPSGSKSVVGTQSVETSAKAASTASKSSGSGSESPIETATRPSPTRIMQNGSKENKKCMLMDITGKNQIVAEGRWVTNDPNQKVHFVPLGSNAVKVSVDIVKVSDAEVWRQSDEIGIMEDAIGTVIAWPEDKVIMA